MNFNELTLSDKMLETLKKMGYETPSEIQQKAIPVALAGKDIIGQAQTGTGKTASFAIPLIERTIEGKGIQHIILAPSRELVKQIQAEIVKLSAHTKIKVANIIGGISYDIQRRDIARKPEILVATPGRLIDHLESGRINIDLSSIKTFVLDEADEMLNFGFYKEMLRIAKFLPAEKQTLFFTATFNKKTKALAQELVNDPEVITVSSGLSTTDRVKQQYVLLKEGQKLVALYNLLMKHAPQSVIVFGRTRRRVDELAEALNKLGMKALGIQGDMRQRERAAAMEQFRKGRIQILIGTDVLARGIDVDGIDLVVNFDLPTETEYYTHRIGRTGRAGNKGIAISFVKEREEFFFSKILQDTSSDASHIPMPTDADMVEVRTEKLEKDLSRLLHVGREKYRNIGNKILEEYDPEHVAMMLAASIISDSANPYDLKLTGEVGIDAQKKGRGGGGGRSRSGGKNRYASKSSGNSRGGNQRRKSSDRNRSGNSSRGKSNNRGNSSRGSQGRKTSNKGKK